MPLEIDNDFRELGDMEPCRDVAQNSAKKCCCLADLERENAVYTLVSSPLDHILQFSLNAAAAVKTRIKGHVRWAYTFEWWWFLR